LLVVDEQAQRIPVLVTPVLCPADVVTCQFTSSDQAWESDIPFPPN
jgi:hypothetical protein